MLSQLTNNPLFGLILSIGMFLVAKLIAKKLKHPVFNPLIVAMILVIIFLKVTHISYEHYYQGGQILNMLIAPATVALAIPLYKSFHLLQHHARSIMVGIMVGTFFSTFLTGILAIVFRLDHSLTASLMPKSVTTAIAIDSADKMKGVPTVTLIVVIVTGIIGAIISPTILKICRIEEPVAKGIAIGSSAHAIGTTKAMELGEVEGAMSGLAIGVTGLVTVFVAPLMMRFIMHLFG